jgi:signal recognition particle subunit SRP54
MLGNLTAKFQGVFSKLSGKKRMTEENLSDSVNEVRLALLEADVNYSVAKTLVKRVKEKSLGEEILKSVTPGQQFIKIVHDELVSLMGGEEEKLALNGKPSVIMLCGLQGSGKTTQCAKLANYLKKNNECRNPLLVACDLQRPAAVEQLKILGQQSHIPVFYIEGESDPLKVAKAALNRAKEDKRDLIIVDTAGRLHIDDELMKQLQKMKEILSPDEILFVANAATGQDAVNIATEFNKKIEFTGTILTMLDGNTRGGAAISIREVTGKPLKFEGIGERLEDIQIFNPKSMADRILGMGDTINLVKKAQEHFTEKEAESLEKKMRSATFTYEDYVKQIQTIKKMGPLKGLLSMLPGASQMPLDSFNEQEFMKTEAMILSMTPEERAEKCELTPSRRKRIAKGSGVPTQSVDKLVKSFKNMKQFFKNMPNMNQLEKMMGGLWR